MAMSQQQVFFKETIYPSLGVSFSLMALDLAMAFALWAALGETIALSFFVVALILSAFWWRSAIHRISFDGETLRVNRARIERRYLGECQSLDAAQWKRRLGVDFDPRFFHAHKFWIKSGVEVEIKDVRDPHPSWLIASRVPEEFARVINSKRMTP